MPDDLLLGKAEILERCVARVREEYGGRPENLTADLRRQDSILLNLQRACEAAIGGAMHLVRVRKLGLPKESREAFELLEKAGILEPALAEAMRRMVGFRNVAIHTYRELDLIVVRAIIEHRLDEFLELSKLLIAISRESEAG